MEQRQENMVTYTMAEPNLPKDIPNKSTIVSRDWCSKPSGSGQFQIARNQERKDLKEVVRKYIQDKKLDISEDFVCYIPNAKLTWANRVLKDAMQNDAIHGCDRQLLSVMWMSKTYLDELNKFIDTFKEVNTAEYAHPNYPTRSLIKPTCDINRGKVTMNVKNPGMFNMETGKWEEYPNYDQMYREIKRYNPDKFRKACCEGCSDGDTCDSITNNIEKTASNIQIIEDLQNELVAKYNIYESTSVLDELNIDPKYKKLINYVRDNLYDRHLSYDKLKEIASAFAELRDLGFGKYYLSILDPFKHRFTKIPTEMPIPSSSFSLRSNLDLTTNASGRVAFCWNPFILTTGSSTSTFGINNDVTLTGGASSNFFLAQDVGTNLPVALYTRYRLVSASLKLTFTTSQLSSTGFGTIAVDFADNAGAVFGVAIATAASYGVFQSVENCYFKETKSTRDNESLQVNYIPLDSSFLDYFALNQIKPGFNIVGYVTGAPASVVVARVDIVANYEALVSNAYTDYLPCQVYTGGLDDLQAVRKIASSVQNLGLSLNPENIKQASGIKESNQSMKLPLPKQIVELVVDTTKQLDKVKNQVVENEVKNLKPKEQKSFISAIMDIINPIGSSLIQSTIGRLNPFKF